VFSDGAGRGTEAVVHLPLHPQQGAIVLPIAKTVSRVISTKRVLVIDDNVDVADMLSEYLQHLGHAVIQARDGRTGLDAAMRHQPEVIVCDLGLPGLDGYSVARSLREMPQFQSSLLIAVSGYGDSADRDRARTAGFSHHITKPADPVELADLIANAAGPE